MNDKTHYFYFTLGPVQGFVSQARRTRDFWAGSFILSWLAAVAIKAVKHQGGEIQFPHADENYMKWLIGDGKENKPTQGSIPNRFKGLVAAVDPNTFKPDEVVKAVQEAWKALADKVWEEDLGDVSPSSETARIWERQIPNFWDMSWVVTKDKDDSSVLDKRKNWRTYVAPKENGVKCSMMDGWQELSGEERPDRKKMNVFWDAICTNGRYGMKSDLRKNEALCSMAFVKRRFSRHFAKIDRNMKQGWRLKGWEVQSAVPSVTYMAAVHWLEQALLKAKPDDLVTFQQAAADLTGQEYGEWDSKIKCLELFTKDYKKLKSLDGNIFFETSLENTNIFDVEKQAQAKKVLNLLKKIKKSAKLSDPTPFYAILLMDGDSLGMHMSNPKMHYSITQGLADFTNGVPAIVQDNNGFLIYAGGDDVLAILPLEDAITCAAKLREHYLKCFKEKPNDDLEKYRYYIPTTLSGAIEFTHINMPLTSVLKDAHNLLDEVAKDGSGRDALAIRVWKRGGLQLEWSQPWKIALIPESSETYLQKLAFSFQEANKNDDQFSNKFFHKIRERFDLINPDIKKNQKPILDESDIFNLMAMEYLNSGKSDLSNIKDAKERIEKAKNIIRPLIKQCRPVIRNKDIDNDEKWERRDQLQVDGALLIRFLAQKGVEKP
ncbi:MAG: hypothetical protein RI964_988 [Pseudomonadota bacterium]|jgi:CRISPR-associated protein Cmr2